MKYLPILVLMPVLAFAREPIIEGSAKDTVVDETKVLRATQPVSLTSAQDPTLTEINDLKETVKELSFDLRMLKSELRQLVSTLSKNDKEREEAIKMLQNKIFSLEENKRRDPVTGKIPANNWRGATSTSTRPRSTSSSQESARLVRSIRVNSNDVASPNGDYILNTYRYPSGRQFKTRDYRPLARTVSSVTTVSSIPIRMPSPAPRVSSPPMRFSTMGGFVGGRMGGGMCSGFG